MALLCLMAFNAKSQNCFNEYNNTVSSLACVNSQAGFDINQYAAAIYQAQDKFASVKDEINYPIGSWNLLQREGNFSNIHQYGFKKDQLDIIITYKIINTFTLADLAIVVAGQPFYHSQININTDLQYGWHEMKGNGKLFGSETPFTITLDWADIIGVKIGDTIIIRQSKSND
jgi:hypothetical protein